MFEKINFFTAVLCGLLLCSSKGFGENVRGDISFVMDSKKTVYVSKDTLSFKVLYIKAFKSSGNRNLIEYKIIYLNQNEDEIYKESSRLNLSRCKLENTDYVCLKKEIPLNKNLYNKTCSIEILIPDHGSIKNSWGKCSQSTGNFLEINLGSKNLEEGYILLENKGFRVKKFRLEFPKKMRPKS